MQVGKDRFSLVMYESGSNSALYSASFPNVLIFLLTHFDTTDYQFESNLGLVLLIKVPLTK